MYSLMQVVFVRKALLLALTVILLAWPLVASAQTIEELPETTDTMISFVSDSQVVCARGRMPHPWAFIARGHARWYQFTWTPETPDCLMNLLIQSSDPDVFRFTHLQRSGDNVNCNGTTTRRITCAATGDAWVRFRLEAVDLGEETLSVYESSSGTARLYDIFVLPDFLWLTPFTVR